MSDHAYRFERLYEAQVETEIGGALMTQRRHYFAPNLQVATQLAVEDLEVTEELLGITQLFDRVMGYA